MNWLKQRMDEIGLKTQDELATELQLLGYGRTRGTISHWINGRAQPPLSDPIFRGALARILKLSESDLLERAGYEVARTGRSRAAEQGADIIDELSPDKQDLALRLLEQLRVG